MISRDELTLIFAKLPWIDLINTSRSCQFFRKAFQKVSATFWIDRNPKLKILLRNPKVDWFRAGYYSELTPENAFQKSAEKGDLWFLKTVQLDPHLYGLVVYDALVLALKHNQVKVMKYLFWKLPNFQNNTIYRILYNCSLKTDSSKSLMYLRRLINSPRGTIMI